MTGGRWLLLARLGVRLSWSIRIYLPCLMGMALPLLEVSGIGNLDSAVAL